MSNKGTSEKSNIDDKFKDIGLQLIGKHKKYAILPNGYDEELMKRNVHKLGYNALRVNSEEHEGKKYLISKRSNTIYLKTFLLIMLIFMIFVYVYYYNPKKS